MSLLHLNIRSLYRNLDSLITLLKNVELRFSFIGITETWLRDSSLHTDISVIILSTILVKIEQVEVLVYI